MDKATQSLLQFIARRPRGIRADSLDGEELKRAATLKRLGFLETVEREKYSPYGWEKVEYLVVRNRAA